MSSLDSESISSSSSSEIGSSLGASQWNRYRSQREVRPLQRKDWTRGENIDSLKPHPNLLKKQYYPYPIEVDATSDPTEPLDDDNEKTGLEKFVLQDCLSNHFLLSHLPQTELEHVCKSFQKVCYRDHEIIYSQGNVSQYLYILYSGDVCKRCDGEVLTNNESTEKYLVLGELAVLTGSPYRETAQAMSNCILFRIGRGALHRCLRPAPEIDAHHRVSLLKQAIPDEVVEYIDETELNKLASTLVVHQFQEGEILIEKDKSLDHLVIIAEGTVVSTDVSLGGRDYESKSFGPNSSLIAFGWQSILEGSKRAHFKGTMFAKSDGVALMLSQSDFHRVLGSHNNNTVTLAHLARRRLARLELQSIPIFQDSLLDEIQTNALLELMHRCEYIPDSNEESCTIFQSGDRLEPAIYFVREGSVTLIMNKGAHKKVVEAGDYFGEQNMVRDQNKDGKKHYVIRSPMTAMAQGRTVLDVLYLEECRLVLDTTTLGLGRFDNSAIDASIQLSDIERHALLGTGSFGQVWLATIPGSGSDDITRRPVAFKVQAKHQILESGKAERMVAERNILASLKSPFLMRLFASFQDESLLYMITELLQGGELESLLPDDGLSEQAAKFYAAGVLEGLAYMHRRHLIHRDIKTTNVLLNERGYPVIIDLGFAKYVPDRTYTFVGSPIYTAPEVLRFQGYANSVDYWAWGILVYRLVTGRYPFFGAEGDELALFKRICRGSLELDGLMTMEFRLLMTSLLYPNPSKRLGSGRNGWEEIMNAAWFSTDSSLDMHKLRRQKIKAPWVPKLKDDLDASSFHPDESEMKDLMLQTFPPVEDEQQQVFAPFGPLVE